MYQRQRCGCLHCSIQALPPDDWELTVCARIARCSGTTMRGKPRRTSFGTFRHQVSPPHSTLLLARSGVTWNFTLLISGVFGLGYESACASLASGVNFIRHATPTSERKEASPNHLIRDNFSLSKIPSYRLLFLSTSLPLNRRHGSMAGRHWCCSGHFAIPEPRRQSHTEARPATQADNHDRDPICGQESKGWKEEGDRNCLRREVRSTWSIALKSCSVPLF